MKIKLLSLALLLSGIATSCGSANQAAETYAADDPRSLVNPQTDLVIVIDKFENSTVSGTQSFIALYGDKITGKVPTVAAMATSMGFSGTYSMVFENNNANISKPYINKKGTYYTFNVNALDGTVMGARGNTNVLIRVTVYNGGDVDLMMESTSFQRIRGANRTFNFKGHVDRDRTANLLKLKEAYLQQLQ